MALKAGIQQPSESDSLYHEVFRKTFVNEILESLKKIAKFPQAIFLDPFPLNLALWEILIHSLPIIDIPHLLNEESVKRMNIELTESILSAVERPKKRLFASFYFEQKSELVNQHCNSSETPDNRSPFRRSALNLINQ